MREIAAAFTGDDDGLEDEHDETEVAFEAANILIGACLASVFEQLNCTLTYSAPRLIGRNIPLEDVVQPDTLHWTAALLLEVNFALEGRSFRAHLITLTALHWMSCWRVYEGFVPGVVGTRCRAGRFRNLCSRS
jgi:chemotaxis protein CheY-P-specific phosphatase CheC